MAGRLIKFSNEDGEIIMRYRKRKGQLHGKCETFQQDGIARASTFTYNQGAMSGPCELYNPNGELVAKGQMRNKKFHGPWKLS